MTTRREILVAVGAGALASPFRSLAQRPAAKLYRVGALAIAGPTDKPPPPPENWEAFVQGLRETGYIEGQNVAFESRSASGDPDRFPELAADLVRRKVDVIFARGPEAVRAAKHATNLGAIPIVAIDLETDPVTAGFARGLARPGGNITGMFLDLAEISGKQLELLKEMVPKLSRVGVLGHPVVNSSQLKAVEAAGVTVRIQIRTLELRDAKDIDGAFKTATTWRAGGLIVLGSPLSLLHRARVADLALKFRLPTMFGYRPHVEAGGLMSYGPTLADMFRRCGVYVGKILHGANPADLPIERPARFELIINQQTASALGIRIPQSILVRADRVIE